MAVNTDMNISSKGNKKHINIESFLVGGKVIGEDGKKYKQTEGIISNGFKVTLEFPEEACEEDTISIDLRNMMEMLAFDGIQLP